MYPNTGEKSGEFLGMNDQHELVVSAIRRLREQIQWRPKKAEAHLSKRIALGHLPMTATIADYEALILHVLHAPTADVFVYGWDDTIYPTVVAEVESIRWLVMLSLDGIMETAFPPEEPDAYFADQRFQRLGTLKELGL